MVWGKHEGARLWCRVTAFRASVETACGGRWDANDEYQVEIDPPASERCTECERSRIVEQAVVRVRVEGRAP